MRWTCFPCARKNFLPDYQCKNYKNRISSSTNIITNILSHILWNSAEYTPGMVFLRTDSWTQLSRHYFHGSLGLGWVFIRTRTALTWGCTDRVLTFDLQSHDSCSHNPYTCKIPRSKVTRLNSESGNRRTEQRSWLHYLHNMVRKNLILKCKPDKCMYETNITGRTYAWDVQWRLDFRF